MYYSATNPEDITTKTKTPWPSKTPNHQLDYMVGGSQTGDASENT